MTKLIISTGHDPQWRKTAEVQRVRDIANCLKNYCDFEQIPDGLGGADENDNLVKKIAWANSRQTKNDFYIAIHSNAGGGTGNETYFYGGDSKSEERGKKLEQFICEETGLKDRGTKPDTSTKYKRLGEVRDTKAWAWLVECGFHDNASDMSVPADKFARGIARFVEYLGLPVRNLNQTPPVTQPPADVCADVKSQLATMTDKAVKLQEQCDTLRSEKDSITAQCDRKVYAKEQEIIELKDKIGKKDTEILNLRETVNALQNTVTPVIVHEMSEEEKKVLSFWGWVKSLLTRRK